MVSSKDKPAVEAAAAEHTRAVLRDAEKAALAAADVTKEQATDAWRYFTSAYGEPAPRGGLSRRSARTLRAPRGSPLRLP